MKKFKIIFLPLFLILIIGCTIKNPFSKSSEGKLTEVSSMIQKRAAHSSTLLNDGTVLIAGGIVEDGNGNETPMTSVEIFYPDKNRFEKIGGMAEPHSNQTATLLENGEVLIIGGWKKDEISDAVEIYNPETKRFRLAARLEKPLHGHNAVPLKDGRVLIIGGSSGRNDYSMEVYAYDYK